MEQRKLSLSYGYLSQTGKSCNCLIVADCAAVEGTKPQIKTKRQPQLKCLEFGHIQSLRLNLPENRLNIA